MLQGTVSLLLKDTIDSLQNTIDSYCMAQQIHIFNRQFYVATEISGIYCKAQYPKPTCSTTHGRYKTCPSQCTGKCSARGYETRSARTRVTTKWITTPIQKFPGKREGKEKKQNKMEGKRKIQKKKKIRSHYPFNIFLGGSREIYSECKPKELAREWKCCALFRICPNRKFPRGDFQWNAIRRSGENMTLSW